MTTANKELTAKSRQALQGKWGVAVGTNFIFNLVSIVSQEFGFIIGGPLQQGISVFSLNLARGKKAEIGQLFDGFKNFANALVAFLLTILFVLLWTLLLIIPGIIAAIAYSQTFFIMADDDKIGGYDAMKKSKTMMNGHKWKYFCLCLRFSGWLLLSILSLGVGLLFLLPYMNVCFANFYDDIKA